jgi:glyoxylase-like metal-dependent hydrolase (beta-lactamase superfamily II)
MATRSAELAIDVFTSAPDAFGVTSTVIAGQSDAVLVDAQFAVPEARRLAESIRGTGKRLTTIYVTHWHPDHWFGLGEVLALYPEARVLALPENVERIREAAPGKIAQWKASLGDLVPDEAVIPEPLTGDTIELEGEPLRIALVGQGDTEGNSAVYVESADTLITGDFTFNGTHVWLADATPDQRREWLTNLDRLEALNARGVVAGHRSEAARDDAGAIAGTRDYIRDFECFVEESSSAEELIERVKAKYGDRDLEVILQFSAAAAFPS